MHILTIKKLSSIACVDGAKAIARCQFYKTLRWDWSLNSILPDGKSISCVRPISCSTHASTAISVKPNIQ